MACGAERENSGSYAASLCTLLLAHLALPTFFTLTGIGIITLLYLALSSISSA